MIPTTVTQAAINTAIGDFIELVTGMTAVVGQVNRVPEPLNDFAVYWPIFRTGLSTPGQTPADSKFTASIAAGVMDVTAFPNPDLAAAIKIGSLVFGTGVADNTRVVAPAGTGTGGVGTYNIAPAPQTVAPGTLSAGTLQTVETFDAVIQVDFHGPASAEAATSMAQVFRTPFAVDNLEGTVITPLYADDPRQTPFDTAAKQYEDRWSVDLHVEIDPVLSLPQEFADAVELTIVNIDTIPDLEDQP